MEDKALIIITTESQFESKLENIFEKLLRKQLTAPEDFSKEKLTRKQVCELAEISMPTMSRRVADGIFTPRGQGRKQWFMRTEVIAALKEQADRAER